jgi:uncharacterized membrane protein YfcA
MRLRLIVSTLAGLLACGLPLWPIPYREVSLPGNPAPAVWILLGALAGLLAGHLLRPGIRVPVLAVTAGFVLAVLGRVGVETTRDPTSHNLWPFEIIIAGGIGLVAALIGVGAVRLLQRVRGES